MSANNRNPYDLPSRNDFKFGKFAEDNMSPRIMPNTGKSLRNNLSSTKAESNGLLNLSASKESVMKRTYGFSIQSSVDNTRDSVDAPKIPTEPPITASGNPSRNTRTIQNQYSTTSNGRTALANQTFTSFNHKNGKAVVRPLSGARYNPYEIIKGKKDDIKISDEHGFDKLRNSTNKSQVPPELANNYMNISPHSSILRLKAAQVSNNSVQRYMRHVDSKEKDKLSRDRFDQSPQPIYPNFEPVKKGQQTR